MSYAQPYGPAGEPLYGHAASETDPATGYTHVHSFYADAYGTYERTFDEQRGPIFDRTYQSTYGYDAGVHQIDVLNTATPLDGVYATDYDTGATVASYDTRWFYAGGYCEYTSSAYAGPDGTATTAGGAYHETA